MYRLSNLSASNRILLISVVLSLITPIFFFPAYYKPFGTPTILSFFFFVQLAFPFYLYSILQESNPLVRHKQPEIVLFFGLIVWMSLSAIHGIDPINSFLGTVTRDTSVLFFFHGFLFVLYLQQIFSFGTKINDLLINTLISVSTLASIYALFEGWLFPTFVMHEGRVASVFGNPIFFSSFLIIPITLSISQASKSTSFWNRYTLISIVQVIALLLTGTRAAFLSIILGLICWVILSRLKTQQTITALFFKKTILTLVTTVFLLTTILLITPPKKSISRLVNFTGASVESRLAYWNAGLRSVNNTPILGLGPENFYRAADQYLTEDTYELTNSWADKPHGIFIEWLMTTGVIGFCLYLSLLVLLTVRIWRQPNKGMRAILLAGLVAYVVQGQFSFHTAGELITFFFFFLLFSPISHSSERQNSRQKFTLLISLMGGVLTIIVFFILILPTHKQLIAIQNGDATFDTEPARAIEYYATAEEQPFVADRYVLAQKYFIFVRNETQKSGIPEILLQTAIDVHQRALIEHPLRARLWNNLSFLYYLKVKTGDTLSAIPGITSAKRAVELAPGRFEPKHNLAILYVANGMTQDATDLVNKLLEEFPNKKSLNRILSEIALNKNNLVDVGNYAYKAIIDDMKTTSKEELVWVIDILVNFEEYQKVIDLYSAWYQIYPTDTWVLPHLATTYAQNGQKIEAVNTALKFKELDPNSAPGVDQFLQSISE